MAKNQHTFAKRQREIEKKRKADEKRARRQAKNRNPDATDDADTTQGPPAATEVEGQPTTTPGP